MAKSKFYAVKVGRRTGIFDSWNEAQPQVDGFTNAAYKSFKTKAEALEYMGDDWVPESQSISPAQEAVVDQTSPAENESSPELASAFSGPSLPAGTPVYLDTPELEQFLAEHYADRQFTPDQKEAIRSVEGRHLLFAIPGSGKTAVLTARAGYMLSIGINPASMLIMTFGKSAATHMEEVFSDRFPGWQMPNFCTIHSFCNSVLKKLTEMTGISKPTLVIDDEDDPVAESEESGGEILLETECDEAELTDHSIVDKKKGNKYAGRRNPVNILSQILVEQEYFSKKSEARQLAEATATVIGCIKNRMMTEDEIDELGEIDLGILVDISKVYHAYVKNLSDHKEMDFDDMLRCAYDALHDYPELLQYYQQIYRYISVDEAQDTSHLQHMIIRLLVGETGHLFMVGDDDQSIYAFRGAAPKEMLDFHQHYRNAVIHRMGINFRSDRMIVQSSDRLIRTNLTRADKDMVPNSDKHGRIRFLDITHEMQIRYVLDSSKAVLRENEERLSAWEMLTNEEKEEHPFKPHSLAVLYRNNTSALVPLAYFFKNDIPFTSNKVFDILSMLYSRTAINLLRLLDFTLKPGDFSAYSHAYYVFNNYKGLYITKEQAIEKTGALYAGHEGEAVLPWLSKVLEADGQPEKARHILEVQEILEEIRETDSPLEAFRLILVELQFNKASSMKSKNTQLLVTALIEIACLYSSIQEYLDAIQQMRSKKNLDAKKEEGQEEIILSTMHSSKGQEYDDVIIIDAVDALIPGNNPNRPLPFWYDSWREQIEEERRLFYVACTRAKHQLEILVNGFNTKGPMRPSRFVKELHLHMGMPEVENAAAEYQSEGVGLDVDELFGRKYFAVRHGKKPGIHDDFEKAGIRGEQGVVWKSFSSETEALRFLNKYVPLSTERMAVTMETPQDLPHSIQQSILSLFGKKVMADFTNAESMDIFNKTRWLYSKDPHAPHAVDYSTCAREYALIYLPLNVMKIWKPLWSLLQAETLPISDITESGRPISILELGAGPGTSTLGLLSFYALIAETNPDINIQLNYTAVEREKNFCDVFEKLVHPFIEKLPSNLSVHIEIKHKDIQSWLRRSDGSGFDLIIESNMVNPNEHIERTELNQLIQGCHAALESFGKLIMIEPDDSRSVQFLEDICSLINDSKQFSAPQLERRETVDLSKVQLCSEAYERDMRGVQVLKHWYSYAIMTKR